MKKTAKILSLCAAVLLALSLFSCSNPSGGDNNSGTGGSGTSGTQTGDTENGSETGTSTGTDKDGTGSETGKDTGTFPDDYNNDLQPVATWINSFNLISDWKSSSCDIISLYAEKYLVYETKIKGNTIKAIANIDVEGEPTEIGSEIELMSIALLEIIDSSNNSRRYPSTSNTAKNYSLKQKFTIEGTSKDDAKFLFNGTEEFKFKSGTLTKGETKKAPETTLIPGMYGSAKPYSLEIFKTNKFNFVETIYDANEEPDSTKCYSGTYEYDSTSGKITFTLETVTVDVDVKTDELKDSINFLYFREPATVTSDSITIASNKLELTMSYEL